MMKTWAITDVGLVRKENQDAYRIARGGDVCVVCDGMGGAAGGQIASTLAAETYAAELEKILKNAEVVVEDEVDLDRINIGCQVKILDLEYDEELDYKIVGSTEANSLKGKISNESPVGKALIGAKIGDIVEVETQAGVIKYKVLEIERSN